MDDALVVRLLERHRDLPGNGEAFVERNRSSRQTLGERRPLDQLHDERANPVGILESENRGDVGMVELREQACLALESRETFLVVDEGGRQHFDRDVTIEPRISGPPDFPIPPSPRRSRIPYGPSRAPAARGMERGN
jgi:hypothetical protein